MKKLALTTLLLTISITAFSQNIRLEGYITSKNTPIPYANIYIESLKIGTTSDSLGFFYFNKLTTGNYTLKASSIGYGSIKKDITINDSLKNFNINIELNAIQTLEEVVVTGTSKETYLSNSPVKIEVISAKKIETYLPSSSASLIESIQLMPGVQEVVDCGVCYTNSISINGLPGAYTAVLIDGTPMFGSLASVYGLNGIPNVIVDRYEIIRGPSSTLYGSEAVAGVINVITKNPEEQDDIELDAMVTTHLESFGNIAFAPKMKKVNGYVGFNYGFSNNFNDDNNDYFGDLINMDRYSFFTKWNFKRKDKKKSSISAKYYYEDRRNGVEEFMTNRAYRELRGNDSIYGESIYTNRAELFGTFELPTKEKLKLDYSYSFHDQNSCYGDIKYEAQQQIGFLNFTWNKPLKKHDIIIGATGRYQYYNDNTVATQFEDNGTTIDNPENQIIPGVFVQDDWKISKKWQLLVGSRLDYYSAHGLIFSPRLNLKYKAGQYSSFRLNFGTGFRTVNLFTEDHAFVTGQRKVEILESLKPEQSYNGSFNYNQVLSSMGGSATLDFDVFYTYFTNKITPNYDTPETIIYANTEGNAQTLGGGINFSQNFKFPLSFNIGANFQYTTQTEIDDEGILTTNLVQFAPLWTGIFAINYKWKKPNLTFSYSISAVGHMALPEVYDVNDNGGVSTSARPTNSVPYSLHTIQIIKKFKHNITIYAGIENLFDYRQKLSPLVGFNDPNASIGFSSAFDTSYAYSPFHGRELFIGIKWGFKKKKNKTQGDKH